MRSDPRGQHQARLTPTVTLLTFHSVGAPRNTPAEIIEKLNNDLAPVHRSYQEERVAVRSRTHDRLGADVGAGARPVLDDEWLAEPPRQPGERRCRFHRLAEMAQTVPLTLQVAADEVIE